MTTKISDEPRADERPEENVKMPRTYGIKRWIPIVIVGILAIALLSFFIFRNRSNQSDAPETPPATTATGTVKFLMEQQWLIRMKLAKVEKVNVARQITSTGRVIPAANRQALVSPPVSGIIKGGQLPRVGQRVTQGQTIAVIQQTATSAEQAQVRASAAQVEAQNAQVAVENARLEGERRAAEGEVESARVRLELAQKEAERANRLFENKAASQRQVQTAEAERDVAQAAYNAAIKRRDALASAKPVMPGKVNVGSANSSYSVRAPLSGYVTKVNKAMGEQVATGEAIIEVSNLDVVWIEAPIFELDLRRLGNYASATFTTAAYPDQEFTGKVLDVGAVIDEQTRAATVIFEVPNASRALRIGMQANVRLDAGESVDAMMIPREAVLEHEGKQIVYVLLSGEEFQRREVTLGDEYGDRVAVLSGLKADERVVTQGALQLKLQELRPADAGAHTHET
ncbi:MAG: efflux RND transporter periplasmic adaptor subunit [Acidobacteriota bacterium]